MGVKTVYDSSLTAIADAIRAKTGKSASMEFPTEFVSEIGSISGGGGYTTDEVGDVTFEGNKITSPISGDIDITVFATRQWAFTETRITSATIRTTGQISGYTLRERTFSNCQTVTDILYMPGASNHGIGSYAMQNCRALVRFRITGTINTFSANTFNSCPNLTDIYVPWAQGAVANAPWSATNATIHYDTQFDSDGNIVG